MSASIQASVYTSHVPAIGAALDLGHMQQNYWRPLLEGYAPSQEWMAHNTPDVIVLVYNDHATAFSLDFIPTFAIGTAVSFPVADEGWGPRPVPEVHGHPELAWHIASSVIQDDFDLTIVNNLPVDHGLTVPLSLLFGQPEAWPCRVVPILVNVLLYPVPPADAAPLGRAIRRALASYDGNLTVQVWGTGGMSHQLQGPRAGLINSAFDHQFMDDLIADPAALANKPHVEYVREAGSEAIELVMWLVARGAMGDVNGLTGPVEEVRRFYHVPASNTAVGHLILRETAH